MIEREVLPLLAERNRKAAEFLLHVSGAVETTKLSRRRRAILDDYLDEQICDLLCEPYGLDEDQITTLETCARKHGSPDEEDLMDPDSAAESGDEKLSEEKFEAFINEARFITGLAGLELDFSDLHAGMSPDEIVNTINQRFERAMADAAADDTRVAAKPRRQRKPTKARLERERLARQVEDAKSRDLKTLYKQLAKALHPDLERDPERKEHREQWMKRLTGAYAAGDLHQMLMIEVEWLGEESGNLAKAGDEKLAIYSMVLKEQIRDIQRQTRTLEMLPEYAPIQQHCPGFGSPQRRVSMACDELNQHIETIHTKSPIILKGGAITRKYLNALAEEYARESASFSHTFGY